MRKMIFVLAFLATAAQAQKPETIVSMLYPKPGKEEALLKAIRDTWAVYTGMGLVTGEHQLYRAESEGGSVYYVQIFTWKDENIPDNAPPEVKKAWADLREVSAKIDFAAVTPVPDRPPTARKSPELSRPSAADTR